MAMGVVYFLLKFNKILEQIVILDLICHFYRRIDSFVFFVLAAFDFSYEAYGFQKFYYFRQKSPIAIKWLFSSCREFEDLQSFRFLKYLTKYYKVRWEFR